MDRKDGWTNDRQLEIWLRLDSWSAVGRWGLTTGALGVLAGQWRDIQQGFWDFRQSFGVVADRVAVKGTTLPFCAKEHQLIKLQ